MPLTIKEEPMELAEGNREAEVRELLKIFYKYFHRYLETLLKYYCRKIQKEVGKNAGKDIEDGVAEITSSLSKTVLEPLKIIDKAVPSLIKVVKAIFKISEQRMLKDITPLVEEASIEDKSVKKMIAEACFEIFKNNEMVFANISAKGNRHAAMLILAQEAVDAVLSYFVRRESLPELSVNLILEAVQQVDHKKTNNIFLRVLENMYKEINASVTYSDKTLNIRGQEEDLLPIKIYSKSGVMHKGKYYNRNTPANKKKSNTKKYGYRGKFNFETTDNYSEESNMFSISNYEFILVNCNKEKVIEELLKELDVDKKTSVKKMDPTKPIVIKPPTPGASTSVKYDFDNVTQVGFKEIKIEDLDEKFEREVEELKKECTKWGKHLFTVEGSEIEDWKLTLTQKSSNSDNEFRVSKNKIKGWVCDINQGG